MSAELRESLSYRAAQTAGDLSSAQSLPGNKGRPTSANVAIFAVAEFPTARSLGALRQPRDDSSGVSS
jgi:hypothetical protein